MGYHERPLSDYPPTVAVRGWRTRLKEADPVRWQQEADKQRERHKARLKSDSEYRAKHCARNNARLKERRSSPEMWARISLNQIKNRAARKGLEFNLEPKDLPPPVKCPVLGIPLVYGAASGSPNLPSVDRIDANKGYVKGNVRVISYRANTIKQDATYDELLAVANYIKREGL